MEKQRERYPQSSSDWSSQDLGQLALISRDESPLNGGIDPKRRT